MTTIGILRRLSLICAVFVLLFLWTVPGYAASLGTMTLITDNTAGTATANGRSLFNTVSDDGSLILFRSWATNLVSTTDTNAVWDAFVYNVDTGTTTLISRNAAGTATGNSYSTPVGISSNNVRVVFNSNASNLVGTTDTNASSDAFLYNINTGAKVLITKNAAGTASANGNSSGVAISADGDKILVDSSATNLVAGFTDTNGTDDIFLYDVSDATFTPISTNVAGTAAANGQSYALGMTPDGSKIYLLSYATNLVSGYSDTNGEHDVFLYDVTTDTMTLVSKNAAGTGTASTYTYPVDISADGSKVLFYSTATDIVTGYANPTTATKLYLYDAVSGTNSLISKSADGTSYANGQTRFTPTMSDDGTRIVFVSYATNLLSGETDTFADDVFLYDVTTDTVKLVNHNPAGTATGNQSSGTGIISPDGSQIIFTSGATNLVTGDTNSTQDAFLYNVATDTVSLISHIPAGTTPGNAFSAANAFTNDTTQVILYSEATNLVTGFSDTNDTEDLFIYTLPPHPPTHLAAAADGENEIDVAWTDNSNETQFRVERSPDGSTGWTQVGTPTAAAFSDTNLICNTAYYYRVYAYRSGDSKSSDYSNIASATTDACSPPAAPTDLTATADGQTEIDLTWTDNSADETEFRVERSADGVSGWTQVGNPSTNAFNDDGLTCNTTYYYRVYAYRAGDSQSSGYSNVDSDTTAFCDPTIPANLQQTGILTRTWVELAWDASTYHTDYRLERAITPVGSYVEIAVLTGTSYVDTSAACGMTYFYQVRAYSSDTLTYSQYSNMLLVTTDPCGEHTPVDFNGDATSEVTIFRGGAWHLYNYASGSLLTSIWTGMSSATAYPLLMDYDGDGSDDLTVYDSGAWHFFNDDGSYFKGVWVAFDALPVPADYDADGDDDLVLFDGGAWHSFNFGDGVYLGGVWTGTGASGTAYPAPMDYDGDGTADFTVYTTAGAWHFFNDDGSYNKGIWVAYLTGIPVPGDYDNDGTDDVVLFDSGAWHWFDFATGDYIPANSVFTGTPTHKYGGTTLPAPLDYDGDGDMDRSMYAGGPWHFFAYDGSFIKNIPTGGVVGDIDLSARPALP